MGNNWCCGSSNNEIRPASNISVISSANMDNNSEEKSIKSGGSYKKIHRSCTNPFFLTLMIVFYIALIVLLIYCSTKGDLNRAVNGFDNCGNICGQKNTKDPAFPCKGEDMTNKKLLLVNDRRAFLFYFTIDAEKYERKCVANCNDDPGFIKRLNRCVAKDFFFVSEDATESSLKEISRNIALSAREIMYLILIAIVISFVLLVLYRYFINYFVTFVFIAIMILAIGVTIFLWLLWNTERKSTEPGNNKTVYLWSSIGATIVTVVMLLLVFILRKRIFLVMQLFKEAGKAISQMPLLIFFPIVSFFFFGVVSFGFIVAMMLVTSAGDLTIDPKTKYYYFKHNDIIKSTPWLCLLGYLWLLFFIKGCQDMCIAGSVGKWFFTRNKSKVSSPISSSIGNVFRYHLGTVALGSFVIALLQFIRIIIRLFLRIVVKPAGDNVVVRAIVSCIECCLAVIQKIVQYLSKNAYIETAINGLAFCAAGRRAFKLLVENASTVAIICSVGSFILFLGKLIIVTSTVAIGYFWLKHKEDLTSLVWPLVVVGILSFVIANIFIGVYEMIIDTLFICYCEDVDQNDGESRPYYMSKDLMSFVENSKKHKREIESGS